MKKQGGSARIFEITVEFFPSKAKLSDGSVRNIERDRIVKLEIEFAEMDPQVLHESEENAVKNWVEKIGESVLRGSRARIVTVKLRQLEGRVCLN